MSSKAAKRRKAYRAQSAKAVSVAAMPDHWDMGARGQANRIGLVQEPVTWTNDKGEQVNPNNVKRMRRVDMLQKYAKDGVISDRQLTAGAVLRDAWAKTEMGQGRDYSDPVVDSSPKPDQAIDIRIDRMSHYIAITRLIPAGDDSILQAVACEGRAIAHLREYRWRNLPKGKVHLADALERLADRLERRRG
ncbi:hypothetical protein [Sulfitobacter sp. 20_GPM-1509m]|uniref:hypothetical protein n=1 Tax=Sulfitobacter sp. 20_GPM-1509m TaxID=1380367 RepID=UPI00048FDBCF|nr:hypothetical protein [Sulfitobacter sp. 20_GPM-1509m]